ncbi:dynein axonemal assembly factor 11-like [Haliotis rufescens]|uniref:dynein axonemal assembly factor 11-like n=1 Tax=Haliotis rufescens TaxID=6454 RepID=UPI00201EBCBE|nr:dynein axonemal assembly factor 11-like [Haliotis rufescens]
MTRITETLIRKRAEHNELEISTLEEVSLHQQDIEKIEHIDRWCRELKILYLQSNLIPTIENVSKLKKLEYLNLALNNVEKIENLEGCESLKKLDLTVNFVGELTSIESLKENYNLKELFLTGNPCTEFEGYRDYVIATLPQLKWLDGTEIDKSERIKAAQELNVIRPKILEQEKQHRKKRERQKADAERKKSAEEKPGFDGRWYTDINDGDKKEGSKKGQDFDLDAEKEFWDEKVPFTPESRKEVHDHIQETKRRDEEKTKKEEKKPRTLFAPDGRPYNVNEAGVDFTLTDDEDRNMMVLDVACFKHMDTSLLDCDVQTNYVRVLMKGKILQLCLSEDVNPDSSTAQRSQITGHLVVTMPKTKQIITANKPKKTSNKENCHDAKQTDKKQQSGPVLLEVDATAKKCVDIGNIVKDKPEKIVPPLGYSNRRDIPVPPNSDDFVDDPDVPPLL